MTKPTIAFNEFVRRQTEDSEFTHWTISEDDVLERTLTAFDKAKEGYRPGVCLVPVEPEGFFSPVVKLQAGDVLTGEYKPRREGEEPRKSLHYLHSAEPVSDATHIDENEAKSNAELADDLNWITMSSITPAEDRRDGIIKEASYRLGMLDNRPGKTPARHVDVVLYRKDVLAEGNENSTDAEWEVVSINARITDEDQPIMPDALIANHFGLDGGTATNQSPEEFVETLRKSVLYWKDKALVAPKVGT